MRKRTALVLGLAFTILLASCGGGDQTPDAILQKMHDRMMESITKATNRMQVADISQTKTDIKLKVNPIPGISPVIATADIASDQAYDVKSDKQHPAMRISLDADVKAQIPAGLMDPTSGANDLTPLNVKVSFEGKGADGKLFVNVKEGTVSVPKTTNAAISDKVKKTWYGTTFEEINAMFNEQMQDEMASSQPLMNVEEMITKTIDQQRMMPAKMKALAESVHFWKGIETLPEQNGMVRVRVESDKAKVQASLDAMMDFVVTANNPFGLPNPGMEEQMTAAREEMHESMKTNNGVVRGVLMADKDTYDFTGFDGEVTDETGKVTATIKFLMEENGNISLNIDDKANPDETLVFTKKADAVEITVGGKKVLTGTVTKEKMHLEGFDETGATVMIADIEVEKATMDEIDVSGKITLPSVGADIVITKWTSKMSNNYKNMTMHVEGAVHFQGEPVVEATIDMVQEEKSSAGIAAETTFQPINALMVDLQPFMQQLQGGM
jgi:hypothetical protein